MDIVYVSDIHRGRTTDPVSYNEFLRRNSMSAGVYRLQAGATDPQQPHQQDELYYVIRGNAQIEIAAESSPISSGSIIFVEAGVPHRFHEITMDLELLVLFAPAETD